MRASRPAWSPSSSRPIPPRGSPSCAHACSRTASRTSTPEALERIAARVAESIRVLEGALIRVVAFASLTGKPVTTELVDDVLGDPLPRARGGGAAGRPRTVEEIQERTAAAFDLTVEDLRSSSRVARVTWARQVAMYLSRELTGATLPAIGKAFGRNHTTVMHACKRTAQRIAEDPAAHEAVRYLTLELGASLTDVHVRPPWQPPGASCTACAHPVLPHRAGQTQSLCTYPHPLLLLAFLRRGRI